MRRMTTRRSARVLAAVTAAAAVAAVGAAAAPALTASGQEGGQPEKKPVAVGSGGAVASVDADASAAGIKVLKEGGNAVDAAVATAAALGVTEPYSAGVGGGGYFVSYNAATGKVETLDGRETAPKSADEKLFQEDGKAIPFEEAVTSGLSVGTPGTPVTWEKALKKWGTKSMDKVLSPAEKLARDGFTVDETFRQQTADNEERFSKFPATVDTFMPGGKLPKVGSTMRNPDLAKTYATLAREGSRPFYDGAIADDVVKTVRKPPASASAGKIRSGDLTDKDLSSYELKEQAPSKTSYRGLDVYGMAPSSSGGTTVGEALNILESGGDLDELSEKELLHRYIEASRVAFADRGRWVGDPAAEDVPTKELLTQEFADSRACLIKDDKVLKSPVKPGDPRDPKDCGSGDEAAPTTYEGQSTTHLTAADKWGNIVSYTLTIEQTGGSGITVPGRGYLLNNELTDFDFEPADPKVHDPNLPGPSKRPRSSMSPTIVLEDGKPAFALGSPGGATIITTVLQTMINHVDRGMDLNAALQAPRASQRNAAKTEIEPKLYGSGVRPELEDLGHAFTKIDELGAATAVQPLKDGRWLAVAEKERRGGGSAMVVKPSKEK